MKYKLLTAAGLLFVLIILPNLLSPFYLRLFTEILILGLYYMGFDIIFGFAGLLNFGMSVFFGLGGYILLWSIVYLQIGLWISLLASVIVCALFSGGYAFMISRFKSHYFVAFTLVISMICFYVAMAFRPITGADDGISFNVPAINLGFIRLDIYEPIIKYYFVLIICAAVFYLVWRFFNTPYGKAIVSLRENENRARMIGYNTTRLKIIAFTLSGVVSGLGGALYVMHLGFTSAHSFFWIWTARAVWSTIIGGVGTLIGAFVGPALLIVLEDTISTWNADLYIIIMGVIMILFIILAPQGIIGSIRIALAKRGK